MSIHCFIVPIFLSVKGSPGKGALQLRSERCIQGSNLISHFLYRVLVIFCIKDSFEVARLIFFYDSKVLKCSLNSDADGPREMFFFLRKGPA